MGSGRPTQICLPLRLLSEKGTLVFQYRYSYHTDFHSVGGQLTAESALRQASDGRRGLKICQRRLVLELHGLY